MQKCSHCGAQNSVKRTTCYQCEKEFTSYVVARSEDSAPRPAASSRWEAIEPVKRPPQPRPLSHSVPTRVERATTEAISSPTPRTPAQGPAIARPFSPRRSIPHVRRMAVFYRGLHTLTQSGISLASACRELEHASPGSLRAVARDMAAAVEAGRPVTSVLSQRPDLLYPWHLGVLRAAEVAGALPEAFDQISSGYEEEWKTRAQIALHTGLYLVLFFPAVLLLLPFLKFFEAPIPEEGWMPATMLQFLVQQFRATSVPLAMGLAVAGLVWYLLSGLAWFGGIQQRVVLWIPMVGRVARVGALDRYLATLAMMLRAGIPLSDATRESALAAGNAALAPRLLRMGEQVQAGAPLGAALAEVRLFNSDALQLAGVGEAAGSLPEMLNRAAEMYRVEHRHLRTLLMRVLLTLFGVLWIVLVGVIFGRFILLYFEFAFRVGDWAAE